MTRYYRSSRYVVHREGCPSQPPSPTWWTWADGKTVAEIIGESLAHGIRHQFCKRCMTWPA